MGKSTVAVNLAFSLLEKGLKVGLLDADVSLRPHHLHCKSLFNMYYLSMVTWLLLDKIYGPSLPFLVPAHSQSVKRSPQNPRIILPLESLQSVAIDRSSSGADGVVVEVEQHRLKMLSFGHVNPQSGAPGAVPYCFLWT